MCLPLLETCPKNAAPRQMTVCGHHKFRLLQTSGSIGGIDIDCSLRRKLFRVTFVARWGHAAAALSCGQRVVDGVEWCPPIEFKRCRFLLRAAVAVGFRQLCAEESMQSCVSPAGKRPPARTSACRRAFFGAVCLLASFLGLLNLSEAATKIVTIPLSLGQEVPLHAPFTRSYSAVQQVAGVAATASFTLTLSASPFNVSFSDIVVNKLSGDLTAVHIHGPCPDENPCNAAVVFDVCGLFGGSCPVGRNVTIPAFSVPKLYHDIISGNKLFYLNFHTAA